ncbi:hypothetical protein M427DRAFT_50036 [Gonapodya prolifera JEL478]|uniref:Uncharacterized protein n=1 Tax=Gonapodya prolifera (strain JEL478) TaxID=1344416 RepID=A0A138ZX57_GONPJ|nr:hypothetical protein M427DRAFT_50036 [Gonapodya prolifera JEL478]|eukprot:KXS09088.1 hypothetical protein M427DRAFT_50036 [Gonapodya prolifera JEL478]
MLTTTAKETSGIKHRRNKQKPRDLKDRKQEFPKPEASLPTGRIKKSVVPAVAKSRANQVNSFAISDAIVASLDENETPNSDVDPGLVLERSAKTRTPTTLKVVNLRFKNQNDGRNADDETFAEFISTFHQHLKHIKDRSNHLQLANARKINKLVDKMLVSRFTGAMPPLCSIERQHLKDGISFTRDQIYTLSELLTDSGLDDYSFDALKLAAQLDHPEAMFELYRRCAENNNLQAREWLDKAINAGSLGANSHLQRCTRKMWSILDRIWDRIKKTPGLDKYLFVTKFCESWEVQNQLTKVGFVHDIHKERKIEVPSIPNPFGMPSTAFGTTIGYIAAAGLGCLDLPPPKSSKHETFERGQFNDVFISCRGKLTKELLKYRMKMAWPKGRGREFSRALEFFWKLKQEIFDTMRQVSEAVKIDRWSSEVPLEGHRLHGSCDLFGKGKKRHVIIEVKWTNGSYHEEETSQLVLYSMLASIHIDKGHGMFAHGQAYVSLSRCTALEGLTLERALAKRDTIVIVFGTSAIEFKHSFWMVQLSGQFNQLQMIRTILDMFEVLMESADELRKSLIIRVSSIILILKTLGDLIQQNEV